MRTIFFAASAALLASTMMATPAQARDESRVWNPSPAEAAILITQGKRVCYGDEKKKKQGDCMVGNPIMETLTVSTWVRPDGLAKNQYLIMTVGYNFQTGQVIRDEAGRPMILAAHISDTDNSSSVWNKGISNVPAALLNGVGAATISTLLSPCRSGNGCGGSTGVTTIVNASSGSIANAALNAALSGSGCGTGACTPPPTPPTGH